MAINRFIVDVETEDPMSKVRYRTFASALNDQAHMIVAEQEDGVIKDAEKNMHGHQHVSTYDRACRFCNAAAQDERS